MKKSELFKRMEKIVNDNLEAYKCDFDSDKALINLWQEDSHEAIWLVRSLGTQFANLTNAIEPENYIDAVYRNMTVLHSYLITSKSGDFELEEITREGIDKKLETLKWYDLKFSRSGNNDFFDLILKGTYESQEMAQKTACAIAEKQGYRYAYADRKEAAHVC